MLNLKTYIASQGDLEVVEEGIKYVWHPNLNFIFRDKSKIESTAVISYDSHNIYLWANMNLEKIPHRLKIKKELHSWWRAGLMPESIQNYLPNSIKNKTRFEIPIISGGLLKPFIELQKQKKLSKNPYITKESYLATIIHEFGHIYYDNIGAQYWFNNKEENLEYIQAALNLYKSKLVDLSRIKISIPSYHSLTELFAFCADYTASNLFWPNHKKDIDDYNIKRFFRLMNEEKSRDLSINNSVLDDPHDFASVVGKIILTKYPNSWPQILIRYGKLSLG